MKKLFYLVLVLNAGFFVWILTQQEKPADKTETVVVQQPSLALLEEAGSSNKSSDSAVVIKETAQEQVQPDLVPEQTTLSQEHDQDMPARKSTEVADVAPPRTSVPAPPVTIPAAPAQTKPTEMLSEATEAGTPNVTVGTSVEKPRKGTINCFELGSFPTMIVADRISSQFRDAGIWSESRLDIQEQKQGHIIFIPTQGSYDRANQIIALIKEKGITDYAILAVDGVRNTVVMGIYRTNSAAERRMEQLKAHGFDVRIKEHIRKRPRYMVDFRETDGKPVPEELWSRISHDYPKANRATRACE